MNNIPVFFADLVSANYISFANHEAFKDLTAWADTHGADFSMQLSEYNRGPKSYIVRLGSAQLTDDEQQSALEKGYMNIAGYKFYLAEGRYKSVGTCVL